MKKRLKDTDIERWPIKEKEQIDVIDTGQPGLILRLSYGGTRTFRVRCKDDYGKTRTVKLGRWDPQTFNVKAAREAAKKFDFSAYRASRAPTAVITSYPTLASAVPGAAPSYGASTFAAVVDAYISEVVVGFRTRKETERCLRKYAIAAFGHRVLGEITAHEIKTLRKAHIKAHGPRQADVNFAVVRSMLLWAQEEDEHGFTCPLKYSRRRRNKGRSTGGRTRVLNDQELRLVWAAASQMGQFGGFVKLLLLTCQRRQCLATARWSDFDGDVWNIREESDGAKGTAETLKLPPLAVITLNELPRLKGNPFVFGVSHNGEHKHINSFAQRHDELRKLIPDNLERWTLHDLRRTSRTRLTDIGVDEAIGEVLLGHSLQGVHRVYNRSKFSTQKADALLRLSEHIAEIVKTTPEGSNVVSLISRRA